MKRRYFIILLAALLACSAHAQDALESDKYLVFWLRQDATSRDKQTISAKWKAVFNDTNTIKAQYLPTYQVIASPTIKGWVLVVREKNLMDMHANPDSLTLSAFNAWKNTQGRLDNPQYFRVARGSDWRQVLADEGIKEE